MYRYACLKKISGLTISLTNKNFVPEIYVCDTRKVRALRVIASSGPHISSELTLPHTFICHRASAKPL